MYGSRLSVSETRIILFITMGLDFLLVRLEYIILFITLGLDFLLVRLE
jgi:hypothetical protein